ncbi:MAG TPA: NAD(P)/FAD-dependent oxidoreductase [Longimicrobium sp.]|uniref:phytoene desaturase family protein n=1 Tax=Longimicrobium sp. TaxID=2029185 RepID=UPI002ED97FF7
MPQLLARTERPRRDTSTRPADFDVAVIGAGMSGMTAALLLANAGKRVVLLEAHTEPGGCAGFFRRGAFSFDVGATTFISFQPGGIGHGLLRELGLPAPPLERIGTYTLCLPDRDVAIPGDPARWVDAWAGAFPELGDRGRPFFRALERAATDFWRIAGGIPSLPLTSARDLAQSLAALPLSAIPSLRWFSRTFADFLVHHRIPELPALHGAVDMLLQDTTQAGMHEAPAPYAFLGLTLMHHGLFRPVGGAQALWRYFRDAFEARGGDFRKKHEVERIERLDGGFTLHFRRGKAPVRCRQLVSSMPVWDTHRIAPHLFRGKLDRFLGRREHVDGAFALYLGVRDIFPADGVHHFQFLRRTGVPLSDGNNFLVSLSPPGDLGYAPAGHRSVSISTHTDPREWHAMDEPARMERGRRIVGSFMDSAERRFPGFADAVVAPHFYPASPLTYGRFTRRYLGMAGNQPLGLGNAALRAIPSRFGTPGFVQIGDTTFPGAGTVACMLSGINAFRACTGRVVRA